MTVPHITVLWSYILLICCLKPSLLSKLVLDIPFSYIPAALLSEAMRVTTILAFFALCYNIFLLSMPYLDIAFNHHVYFQQLGKLKTPRSHHV